jgi:tetratricopeptide (TPR) repeat protein
MYGLAIKLSERALRRWPQYRAFQLAELGTTYSAAGDLEHALECLKEACELEPANASYHLWLSCVYEDHVRLAPAIDHCERFVSMSPDLPESNRTEMGVRIERMRKRLEV